MNAVVQNTAGTAVGALKSLRQGIANVQQTLVRSSANPYLRMLRDGEWVYGQEDIQVEAGSLWAANPMSLQHGWTAWKKAKGQEKIDNSGGPVGEAMVPLSAPLPPKDSLPDHMDVNAPWEYQTSIELICLNGTDKGEQVVYKASSKGAVNAMDSLIKAIGAQLDADETKPVPVIKFGNDTYNHKEYGKTYVPVLEVVDWVPLTDQIPEVGEVQQRVADPVKTEAAKQVVEEEDEIAKMERLILEKKLAKDKAAAAAKAEPTPEELAAAAKAKRLAELQAEMAALDGSGTQAAQPATAQAEASADGKPLRRRRQA